MAVSASPQRRIREYGVRIGTFEPGAHNAITDVAGVLVGHSTIIADAPADQAERSPVRTGVTVIQPRDRSVLSDPVHAGCHTLNGNGEMTGLEWIRESGLLTSPIALTNTHSVGVVRDALIQLEVERGGYDDHWSLPVVGETYDGLLNDINGFHVTGTHVREAVENAVGGPVHEGSVGGGTGMICHEFKGGIGTSSRLVPMGSERWTIGVLVQANHGARIDLRVDGLPVGRSIPVERVPTPFAGSESASTLEPGAGSIIVVVATDAPLLPDQCVRLARRTFVGVGRVGGGCADSSGDIALAFTTANHGLAAGHRGVDTEPVTVRTLPHQALSSLFQATADATEEAILNALVTATSLGGRGDRVAHALDGRMLSDALRELGHR